MVVGGPPGVPESLLMFVQKINREGGRMEFQKHMRPWAPKPWGPRGRLWGTRAAPTSLWGFASLFPPTYPILIS